LAFNADRSVLYGIASSSLGSLSQLVTIDPTTGLNTLVGDCGIDLTTLTSLADGRLFGVGYDDKLYQINSNTGAATLIGPTLLPVLSPTLNFGNSLASDGATLYYTLEIRSGATRTNSTLYRLSLTTGAATPVGLTVASDFAGSAFAGPTFGTGQLYGFSEDGYTYAINLTSGVATRGARNALTDIFGGVGIITVVPPTVALTDMTRCQGETVTLAPVVGGPEPFTYQWRRNGLNVPDATNA